MKKSEGKPNGELHEIKNKKRSRVVKDKKKGGVRLKAWTKRRKLRALLPVCMLAILIVGVFTLGSFGNREMNDVDLGFVTVSYPVPQDGSTPDQYTGIENIGFMNSRLMAQQEYYAEMHSLVNTIIPQTVDSYKQYSNGVLVQSEIAKSSLINDAQQFCFVGDDVLWRAGSGSVSSWNGIDTPWKTGTPAGHMKLEDFKKKIGLPGTDFSVYVLREETILSAEPVINNGDGTYTQTFHLDPASDKAPMYYENQMIFKGGLASPPDFEYITVTYTFDATWQVLVCEVEEKYTVTKKGIPLPASCVATSRTEYEYGTEKSVHSAYEEYFKNYVDAPVIEAPSDGELTAVECLGAAFSSVLTEPTTFSLALDLNGTKLDGVVYVDLNAMDIRARLGNIYVRYGNDGVYLNWGDIKLKTTVEELMALIGRFLPDGEGNPDISAAIDADAILADLVKNDLVIGEGEAKLSAELNLLGFVLPVNFRFLVDENSGVTLGDVTANISLGDFEVGATLAFGDEKIPALTDEEKSEYVGFVPYAEKIADLLGAESLSVSLDYYTDSFAVSGSVNIALNGGVKAQGDLFLTVGESALPVSFGLENGTVYLNVNGLKVCANVQDAVSLIAEFAGAGSLKNGFDLSGLFNTIFSPDFISNIAITETDDALDIVIKGTELLQAFGIDFALGNVELSVTQQGIAVSVLGANAEIAQGESFTVEKDGYIEILPYAEQLIELFRGDALSVAIDYAQNGLFVNGEFTVNLDDYTVGGTVTLGYKEISKSMDVVFTGGEIYLAIDGLKLKASVQTVAELAGQMMGEESLSIDVRELLQKVLSLDFGALIELSESENRLEMLVHGSELLAGLGIDFALGDVSASLQDGKLAFGALGIAAEVQSGEKYAVGDLNGYADIAPLVPYVGVLKTLLTSEVLQANIEYSAESFAVSGTVNIAIQGEIRVSGTLTVTVGEEALNVTFGYEGDTVYLDLAGIKVKGNVSEIIALVQNVLPGGITDFDTDLQALIDTLLSAETLANIAVTENDGTLQVLVKGTELLQAFGIDFALGNVEVAVTESGISANVLGINASIKQGESFAVEKEGYTDILPYTEQLIEIFRGEALSVTIGYAQNGFSVNGELTIDFRPFSIFGTVEIVYGEFAKTVGILYLDDEIYLAVDGLKVKLETAQLFQMLGNVSSGMDISKLISAVMSLDFSSLIEISESENRLEVLLHGTEILKCFGVEFGLGDVAINVSDGKICLGVLGAQIEVLSGQRIDVNTSEYRKYFASLEEYKNISALVAQLPSVLDNGTLFLHGNIDLVAGDTVVSVVVQNGAVTWRNGFELYLDLLLDLSGTLQEVQLSVTENYLEFAYGQIGARVYFSEFKTLDEAFVALYNRIKAVVDQAFDSASPLPENVESILDLLKLLTSRQGMNHQSISIPQIGTILNGLTILPPASENGLCVITCCGVSLELFNATQDSLVGVGVTYAQGAMSVEGALSVIVSDREFPQMPEIVYLETADFVEMLDYVGAAVEAFAQQDITLSIAGNTVSSADSSVVCDVTGTVIYHAGERFPFHIDIDKKNFYVNTDLYLYLNLQVVPTDVAKDGVYLEAWVLDYDSNDELDFFVSLSRFAENDSRRDPIKFYSSAGELMTVLSDACALLGVDVDIVNNYLVSKWLSANTAVQLRAIGDMLKKSMGLEDLLNGLFSGAATVSDDGQKEVQAFVNSISAGRKTLTITLNSAAIFGESGLNDLTVEISKAQGEDGVSYLTAISLSNIYGNGNSEITDVRIGLSFAGHTAEDYVQPQLSGYTKLEAIGKLFSVLANSVTHQNGEGGYDLNDYYYISGKATISALSFNVNLDPLAISVRVGEDGSVALNVCIGYPVVVGLINGGGTLDISIRGDMIYLRRTQKTKATFGGLGSETLSSPIVLYRAMPLSVFAEDIMNQLAWMLNLSDSIKNQMTNGSGSSGSTEKEIVDYGTMLYNYISKVEYQAEQQEDAVGAFLRDIWTLTLNGSGISGGVMDEIIVKLLTDRSGSLSELNVETSVTYGITIGIKASLLYHNASERVNSPVNDLTEDISYRLEGGMSKAIREAAAANWKDAEGNVLFVEGQYTTLSYSVGGVTIATQHVVLNAQTGELYADLILPDITSLAVAGYSIAWDLSAIIQPDGSYRVTPEEIIQAKFTPNRYTVIFRSERPLPYFSDVPEYSAVDGKSYYTAITTYVYDDGFYFADGTKFVFPDVEIEGWHVEAFCDAYGNEYGDFRNCGDILADVTLTAKWEQTEYTIVYEVNGKTYEQKAHHGDAFIAPTETERRGYVFLGWSNGDTLLSAAQFESNCVEGNVRFVAVYEAEIYQIRLESEYFIDDTFRLENGVWVKTFAFTYGTQQALPSEIRYNGYFLDGFVFDAADAEEHAKTFVPDTLYGSATLFAKWSEIQYQITYVADGIQVAVQNYGEGDALKNLPAVPGKIGYNAIWRVAEGYTVQGDDTIYAVYTAIVYEISVFSDFALEGFIACGNGYVRCYSYEYDNVQQELALPDGYKVPGYDFGGYYTEPNGRGNRVEKIDNGIVGIEELYLFWDDNTVTVTLYSDVWFAGAKWDLTANAYSATRSFNDIYTIGDEPKTEKFQQLGWWYQVSENEWQFVNDVKDYDGKALWAIWIQNLTVNLTELSPENPKATSTYTIRGEVTGGAPYGKGKEIFASVGATESVTGKYYIYFSETKFDELNFGKVFTVNYDKDGDGYADQDGVGEFGASGSVSWSSFWSGGADFGGVEITKTFAYTQNGANLNVSTTNKAIVSFAKYTVTYMNEPNGEVLSEVSGVRAPINPNSERSQYVDEIALISVPEKQGYSGIWAHEEVRGNMTVYPVYTPNFYSVRFESAQKIDNWNYDSASETYFIVRDMLYGAEVRLYEGNSLVDGTILNGQLNPFIVTDGDNVVVLPEYDTGRKWTRFEISASVAEFFSYNTPDIITYKSDVAFSIGATDCGTEYSLEYENAFVLPDASEVSCVDGYVFLGWYQKSDAGWTQVTELTYSHGQACETVVEALWQVSATVLNVTGKRSGVAHYTNKITVTPDLSVLRGAFINDGTVERSVEYYYRLTSTTTSTVIDATTAETTYTCSNWTSVMNRVTVTATVTFVDANGRTVYSESASGSASF